MVFVLRLLYLYSPLFHFSIILSDKCFHFPLLSKVGIPAAIVDMILRKSRLTVVRLQIDACVCKE
jgi:hypothetical protein